MPTLAIRLLGRPEIVRDEAPAVAPRGHKAWAVLAYVILAERPVARAQLAELVFGDADDPRGALRWTLAQLRRALGVSDALRADPLELQLPADAFVDALSLSGGAADVELARGELLEGVTPNAGAIFDAWLLVERRRLTGLCEAVLREAALSALAAGKPRDGAALASRALALNEFDETAHELLVRCLARAGEVGAARHHVTACEVLFRRELGRVPDPRVRHAADADAARGPGPVGDRMAALGQLKAGRAAVDAGATDPGVACLRGSARSRRLAAGRSNVGGARGCADSCRSRPRRGRRRDPA
jgi:DNA-binding SARP family transcriptional activator